MHEPEDEPRPARPGPTWLPGLSEGWIQLVRFALVGGLGTVTNLALFYAFVDLGGLDALVGIVVCFAIAVTQNYALNELWTFATRGRGALSLLRYVQFVAASLVGLGVNTLVYVVLTGVVVFPLKVIPQAVGIAAGTAVNFLASRYLVFRRDDRAG
jgi:putative flippase GtrA